MTSYFSDAAEAGWGIDMASGTQVLITALKRNSLDDGPGIRTVVFFKGCPLSCVWCQNPEAKTAEQQIVYERENCTGCFCCMRVCDQKAITIREEGGYPVDTLKCRVCGQCIAACKFRALRFAGTSYTTDELCRKLLKDRVFYKNSNGGVTFSGGEPTANLNYVSELAVKLKEHEIHLCLETCGFYKRELFEQMLLPYLDLVYFDIKIFDREAHKKYCGVPNDIILDNFSALFGSGKVKVLPRIPLVPGLTAEKENLAAIRDFFRKCGVKEIGLLPYNPLWLSKLSGIGAAAEYSRAQWMETGEKNEVKEIFKDFSFRNF